METITTWNNEQTKELWTNGFTTSTSIEQIYITKRHRLAEACEGYKACEELLTPLLLTPTEPLA